MEMPSICANCEDAGKLTTLGKYAEAQVGGATEMTRDVELFTACTRTMETQKTQKLAL